MAASLKRRVEYAKLFIARFAQHSDWCDINNKWTNLRCSCGFSEGCKYLIGKKIEKNQFISVERLMPKSR